MGIRVAFINGPEVSLGGKYLSAALKARGHDARLFFDPQLFCDEIVSVKTAHRFFDRTRHLVKSVVTYDPQLLAFSVTTDFYPWALGLAGAFKRAASIPIIFGGIHPTSAPEDVLGSGLVDMVCIGEGEYALADLADSLAAGMRRHDIENIWFQVDGKTIRNKLRPLADLNALPVPDHRIYHERGIYFRTGYHTMASRGCLYRCSYCCHWLLKDLYPQAAYYRTRKVTNLVAELASCKKQYGIKVVRFHDDIFPVALDWLQEFRDSYARQVGLPFICYLHPELVDRQRVALLKTSGCREIRLGIQSLNPGIRKEALNRNESTDTIRRAIDVIKEHKLNLVTENMLGLPGQKDADMIELLRFYNAYRPTRNHYFWLRYYPGTALGRLRAQESPVPFVSPRVFTQGGDTAGALDRRLVTFLYLEPLLPPALVNLIIEKKLWKLLPVFALPLLNIFSNLTSRTLCDTISRKRALYRYLFS